MCKSRIFLFYRTFWRKVSFFFLIISLLLGCLSQDEEPPFIESDTFGLKVFNTVSEAFDDLPANGTINVPGSFVVASNIRDNVLIDRIEVTITPDNNDAANPNTRVSIFPWEASGEDILILSVKGTAVNVFREITIPTSAQTGSYNFSMQVYDEEGNSSESFNTTFNIVNENPKITLTSPIVDLEEFLIGSTLPVTGTVEAENTLQSVSVSLGAGDNFSTINFAQSDLDGLDFTIDTGFFLVDSIGIGSRFLRVNATDITEKSGSIEVPIIVEEF